MYIILLILEKLTYMKIFIIAIATSIFGSIAANSVTAQWTPNESMFEGYTNDRLNSINQPGNRNSEGTVEDTISAARIVNRTAVVYIKDETLDTGNLREAMDKKNVEIGFADEGEEVTIVEQTERMNKVRFNETGRLGWVSPKALVGL